MLAYTGGFLKCKSPTPAYDSTYSDRFDLIQQVNGSLYYYWNSGSYLGYFSTAWYGGKSESNDEIHDSVTAGNYLAGFNSLGYYTADSVFTEWYQDPIPSTQDVGVPSGYTYCDYNARKWKEVFTTGGC